MKKTKRSAYELYQRLEQMSVPAEEDEAEANQMGVSGDGDENTSGVHSVQGRVVQDVADTSRIPRMKRFRFQLLHQWLIHNFTSCKAADVGGGKGLLSYLLASSGWNMTVIDPVRQPMPEKYKDILTGRRVKIEPGDSVQYLQAEFTAEQAAGYDLLIGMHAHGCNAKIIEAAAQYGCAFVLFPCCVIDEPFYPPLGVHWLESLADYAVRHGRKVQPFRLNFKGQNIGLVSIM